MRLKRRGRGRTPLEASRSGRNSPAESRCSSAGVYLMSHIMRHTGNLGTHLNITTVLKHDKPSGILTKYNLLYY